MTVASRPLKVALFVHYFFPEHIYGTEAYTLLVARELQALGHDVTVVTATGAGEPEQAEFLERYDWQGVPVWRLDKNALPNREIVDTYDQPGMRPIHERVLRALQPDLVHVTHLINHTSALLEVTQALGIPTFATLTDFFGFCFNNRLQGADGALCHGPNAARSNCTACYLKDAGASPWASPRLKAVNRSDLVRRLTAEALARGGLGEGRFGFRVDDLKRRPDILRDRYRAYRAMVAPTTFLRDAYAANGFSPLALSHFGIDIDRSPKPASPEPERTRIAFIGQMAPHKGPHLLLEALHAVGSPRLLVDLWGSEAQDPAYAARLRSMAAGLPVRFRGTFKVEDTAAVMAETDVLSIPSTWYENSPLILLQALATHTPVVVSDVLGLTEFVEPGRSGVVFKRGDASDLARALRLFADDPALAGRMSEATAYTRTPTDMVADLVATWAAYAPEVVFGGDAAPPPAPVAEATPEPPAEAPNLPLRLEPIRERVTVVDASALPPLTLQAPSFLQIAPSTGLTPPTPPLLLDDPALTEEWYAPWHAANSGETPDVGVYCLPDGLYHPRGMVMADTQTVLSAPELMPQYWRNAVEEGRIVGVDRPGGTERVDRPVIACVTPGFLSFGHILLETLPRLWLARRVLGDAFSGCLIPLHQRFPGWAAKLLQTVAGAREEQFVRCEDNGIMLRTPMLIAPGMLHADFHWHPMASDYFDGLEAAPRPDLPREFAIRRPRQIADAGAANRRVTDGIDEVEALFERRGLPLISPERLAFSEQVALFRQATLVVGEYGSALHGTIFSPASTRVLCLGFDSDVQTKIAAFRGQRMAYVRKAADVEKKGVRHSRFDLEVIDRALAEVRRAD